MNFKRSGKSPDILKFLAVLSALTIVLAGCQPQTVSGGDPVSPAVSDTSTDENTHIPETSDIPSDSENTSDSTDGMSDSSDGGSSSTDSSSTDNGSANTDSSSTDNSSASTDSSSTDNGSASTDSSSTDSDSSSSDNSSSSSVEPISEAPETSEPPESSSSSEPPIPSSSVEPDPPPVVVIPDVKVPTSPGSQLITGTSGVIDCSNASLGYVSARYTGSSSKLKFRVEANGQTPDNYDFSADGSTEYFPLTFGSGTYTLTVFEQIPGATGYAVAAQGTVDVQLASSLSPYLYPNRYVSYDRDSDCVYKAAELCAGKTDEIDKIAAIFMWVANNISYDYDLAATVTTGYIPDPDRTLSRRTGICFDYASLMAAMLRSQSIPSRLVIGYAAPDIYHAWNEVYTEQTGWITPELMFKNAGYNIADATFYSTTPDKAQIAAYISNNGNYAATKYR